MTNSTVEVYTVKMSDTQINDAMPVCHRVYWITIPIVYSLDIYSYTHANRQSVRHEHVLRLWVVNVLISSNFANENVVGVSSNIFNGYGGDLVLKNKSKGKGVRVSIGGISSDARERRQRRSVGSCPPSVTAAYITSGLCAGARTRGWLAVTVAGSSSENSGDRPTTEVRFSDARVASPRRPVPADEHKIITIIIIK